MDDKIKIKDLNPISQNDFKEIAEFPITQDGETYKASISQVIQKVSDNQDDKYFKKTEKIPNDNLTFGEVKEADKNVVSGGDVYDETYKRAIGSTRSSKNIFDKKKMIKGFYVSESTGVLIDNPDFFTSDFIPIDSWLTYYQNGKNRFAFYSQQNENSFTHGGIENPIMPRDGDNFVRICNLTSEIDEFMVYENIYNDTFEPFQNYKIDTDNIIGIDNYSNNVLTESVFKQAPAFAKKYFERKEDVTVVLAGDSVSTNNYYTTPYADAGLREPIMTEQGHTSLIAEQLRWEGQEYTRWDKMWTEEQNVSSSENKDYDMAWDWVYDNNQAAINNRPALTRVLIGNNVSVKYNFFKRYKRADFIYRTDYLCAVNSTVIVSAGNGVIVVFDENTSSWIEANGYVFSAKEDDVLINGTIRKSIYQKRLKLRVVSVLQSDINITIQNNGEGRLCYWGVLYSKQYNVVNFINNARGGHSIDKLSKFEEWDIDYWKPNLILWQVPMINEGLDFGNADFSSKNIDKNLSDYTGKVASKALSFKNKDYNPDVVSWFLWYARGNNAIDNDNNYVFANTPDSSNISVKQVFDACHNAIIEVGIPSNNLFSLINSYCFSKLKNNDLRNKSINDNFLKGTGTIGRSLTVDGAHYNNRGSQLIVNVFNNFFK